MANLTDEQLADVERCLVAARGNPGSFPLTYAVRMYAELQRSKTAKKLYLLWTGSFHALIRAENDIEARDLLKRDWRNWTDQEVQALTCADRGEICELTTEGDSSIILVMRPQ